MRWNGFQTQGIREPARVAAIHLIGFPTSAASSGPSEGATHDAFSHPAGADDAFLVEFPTQWWYWTGHLATDDGRRFGFEISASSRSTPTSCWAGCCVRTWTRRA